MKLKILIVDNEDLLRDGLKAVLKNKGQDWEVLDACDGISAVRIAKKRIAGYCPHGLSHAWHRWH